MTYSWQRATAPNPTSWHPPPIELMIPLGRRTARSFDLASGIIRLRKARFGRFPSMGRICIRCLPPGTLLQTNVAANGLQTGDILFSSHEAISGHLRKRGFGLEKPTANPYS